MSIERNHGYGDGSVKYDIAIKFGSEMEVLPISERGESFLTDYVEVPAEKFAEGFSIERVLILEAYRIEFMLAANAARLVFAMWYDVNEESDMQKFMGSLTDALIKQRHAQRG